MTDGTGRIDLVVFDMAGTTVQDSGLVEQAFLAADRDAGLSRTDDDRAQMLAYVADTMGQSKIAVFRHLARGDEDRAQAANAAFERRYAELVAAGRCRPIPGAEELLGQLRVAGVKTALTTGFARDTQMAIIDALGWDGLADVVLCPGPGVRGRPYPDMVLTCLMATGTDSVHQVMVVGDTASDVTTGLRAGAGAAVGVLTGAHDRDQLAAAGATHIVDSVIDIAPVVEDGGKPA